MADDKLPVTTTDKPVVESSSSSAKRSSSGGRGGGVNSGAGNRSQNNNRRQESREDNSSETSVSGGTSSPGKPKGVQSSKERRSNNSDNYKREGRQRRRGGGGGGSGLGKESQGNKSTLTPGGATGDESQQSGVGAQGQQQEATSSQTSNKKNKSKYAVRKRAPPKEDYEIKPNDVFVNEKSHFVAQLSRCKKLFEKGHREVFLHGLGKAIPRAINIAFELKKFYHETVDFTVNTSTVQLFDDIIDLENPDQPPTVRTRNVSSVDIKVFRSLNIP